MEDHNELMDRILDLILREILDSHEDVEETRGRFLLLNNDPDIKSVTEQLIEKHYNGIGDIETIKSYIIILLLEISKIIVVDKSNEKIMKFEKSERYKNDGAFKGILLIYFASLESEFYASVYGRLIGLFINGRVSIEYLCDIDKIFKVMEDEKYKLLYFLMEDKDKIYHIEYIEKKLAIHDVQNHLDELVHLDLVIPLSQSNYMINHKGEFVCKVLQGLKPY